MYAEDTNVRLVYSTSNEQGRARRKSDERKTDNVIAFLDKEVYPAHNFVIRRVTDENMQKKGIDLIHNENGNKQYVDEKFSVHYSNGQLKTYSFELSSKNNVDSQGWFTSDDLFTTHYILLWINKASDEELTSLESYDICCVSKKKLLDYAKHVGYSEEVLKKFNEYWELPLDKQTDTRFYEKKITNENGFEKHMRYMKLNNGCKICQTMHLLPEQPTNLIIPKYTILNLADWVWSKI